jgi:uncharacterized membrane protein YphA (DoxX/SURF4 family)
VEAVEEWLEVVRHPPVAGLTETVDATAVTFRFVLAFVFAAAAIPKLAGRREFEHALQNYSLLPSRLVPLVALWLPRLDLVCAAALVVGVFVRPFALGVALLLLSFSIAVAINLARGRRFDCGCQATVAPRSIGWGLVAADLVLAGMAALVATTAVSVLSVDNLVHGTSGSLAARDALALALLAATVTLASQLVSSALRLQGSMRSMARSQ